MKKILIIMFVFFLVACGNRNAENETREEKKEIKEETDMKNNEIQLIINGETIEVEREANETIEALKQLIQESPLTIDMSMYGGFEQVGSIGTALPRNDVQMTTTSGDIVLYSGNQLVLFYGSNSWSYTKLGRMILKQDELENLLGESNVKITLCLKSHKESNVGEFDFESKTVVLNDGYRMPILGLGTYSLDYDTCVNSVKTLLENGGRLIDTAYMYHNEEAVGQGIREAMEEYGIPREDIYVITKIYPSQFSNPEEAIDRALEKLNIDYIDMMLLHHPGTGDVKAYLAMEKYVEKGQIKSLGLSNWYIEELTDFLPRVNIMPALVQNEIHPYYQEKDVVAFIQEKGIVVQGWYPLGGRGYTKELLNDEVLLEIANNHDVSTAQVILRWNLQRNIVIIPGSSNPDHIKENLDLFSFELSDEEMEKIDSLDRNEKHDWY